MSFKSNMGDFHANSNHMKHGQSSHYTVTACKLCFIEMSILKPSKQNEETHDDGMKALILHLPWGTKQYFLNSTVITYIKKVHNITNDYNSDKILVNKF